MSKTLLMYGDIKEDEELVADLNPAKAKEFWRINHLISKTFKVKTFNIHNSRITQSVGNNAVIDLDLRKLLGDNFNMKFSASIEELNILKKTTGNSDQIIVNCKSINGYRITDGSNEDVLDSVNELHEQALPDDSKMIKIGRKITLSDAKNIKARFSKCKQVNLLIYGDNLEKITDGQQVVNLSGLALTMLKGKNPDMTFSSRYFLKIADDSNVELTVGKEGENYWLITGFELGLAKGTLFELI